ncbi:MAG: BatD family protein, partial [Vicinamibacteria bacterium]
ARMVRFFRTNAMRSRMRVAWIPFLFLTFLPRALPAQDLRVEASVNANRIGLDDDLQLTVTIYGDSLGRASAPKLPQYEGFRLAGQSTSTSIQWVNGQMSATRSIIYRMTPLREGKFLIDSIAVTYQGTDYLTDPIEVEVISGSVVGPGTRPPDPLDRFSPPQRRNATTGKVFVEAVLSSPSVYVGEQVVLSYRLCTQVPIMGLDIEQRPQLTGFWVEEVQAARNPEPQETTVNGETFYVFDLNPKSILFPTKAGDVTIGPATFSMAVRGSSDPFDSFFFRTADTIRRSSEPVTLTVKPLPTEGRPANFSGAVGQYELGLEVDKEKVAAGDPLTVDVVVQGQGNLKTVEVPELPTPQNFRAYEPKT